MIMRFLVVLQRSLSGTYRLLTRFISDGLLFDNILFCIQVVSPRGRLTYLQYSPNGSARVGIGFGGKLILINWLILPLRNVSLRLPVTPPNGSSWDRN